MAQILAIKSMSHAEANKLVNKMFADGVSEVELTGRIVTMRQWQRIGMDAEAVGHLLMAVPVRVVGVIRAR